MKLISLLITLVIVGFLVNKQLGSNSSSTEYEHIIGNENTAAPKAPTTAKDVQEFEKTMNKFVLDTADQRAKDAEESLTH